MMDFDAVDILRWCREEMAAPTEQGSDRYNRARCIRNIVKAALDVRVWDVDSAALSEALQKDITQLDRACAGMEPLP